MGKYDLNDRLIDYAVLALKLIDTFPNSAVIKHFGSLLMRSATPPGLNYGEAQGADMTKDFIHKMRIVLKELRESKNCLLILERYGSISNNRPEISETNELIAIFTKSIETASKKSKK